MSSEREGDLLQLIGDRSSAIRRARPSTSAVFADARLADDERVVLAAPDEDVDDLPHLGPASEDGIHRPVLRLLREVRR